MTFLFQSISCWSSFFCQGLLPSQDPPFPFLTLSALPSRHLCCAHSTLLPGLITFPFLSHSRMTLEVWHTAMLLSFTHSDSCMSIISISCDHGNPLQSMTVYLSLTGMPSTHSDTIMTAVTKAQRISYKTGQKFTLFTPDQQLSKVAVQIICIPKSISKSYSQIKRSERAMSFLMLLQHWWQDLVWQKF